MVSKFEFIQSKIKPWDIAMRDISRYRFFSEEIVFTNGCFDILHRGHVEYLAQAAALGKRLVVGLNSDASVKRLKGNNRPVNDEYARAMVLASLGFVDLVLTFEEDTPLKLIQYVQPDILVKGSDYKIEDIVGADEVIKNGGRVMTITLVEGFSTTTILRKLK